MARDQPPEFAVSREEGDHHCCGDTHVRQVLAVNLRGTSQACMGKIDRTIALSIDGGDDLHGCVYDLGNTAEQVQGVELPRLCRNIACRIP